MLYTLTMIDNMFVISPVSIVLSATKRSVLVTRLKRQECVFIIYFYIHTLYYNIQYYILFYPTRGPRNIGVSNG